MIDLLRLTQLRFTIIGSINTAVDFLIFLLLTYAGVAPIFANIISTSSGMTVSFMLNRSFVFSPSGTSTRTEIVRFLFITLTGLWILQNIMIYAAGWITATLLDIDKTLLTDAMSKLFATMVSMIWNYYWYKNYVFGVRNDKKRVSKH